MTKAKSAFPANPAEGSVKAAKQPGYAHAKGARAAARKVMGADAVEGAEFELVPLDGDRFDWKAVEKTKAKGRKSEKGAGIAPPTAEGQLVEPLELGPNLSNLEHLPTETVTEQPLESQISVPIAADLPPAVAEAVSAAASAFGAVAMATLSLNAQQRSARAGEAVGGRRETDKVVTPKKEKVANEVKNGVRKPSAGTVCRAVWDELEKLESPDSKAVKALAERMNWNPNNASIEFYQWRKFNGIKGRIKAAPVKQSDKKPAAKPIA